jgi:hypothetical protein
MAFYSTFKWFSTREYVSMFGSREYVSSTKTTYVTSDKDAFDKDAFDKDAFDKCIQGCPAKLGKSVI